jgi:2,3-diketo-5-methylthio-1-phosphopentane phosphatase
MRVILMDIEGTTTSISFVYDVLFPWARAQMEAFVASDEDREALAHELALLRSEIEGDEAAGRAVRTPIPAGDVDAPGVRSAIAARALELMDADVKSTGLKSLQGRIWRKGYESGALRGHLFADVAPAMRRWHEAGVRLAIYSSGSVEAQRLLFAHSEQGDLTGWIEAYFDTTTGPKREARSYRAIAQALGVPASDVQFLTDQPAEAQAAVEAGMKAVLLERPGNAPVGDAAFPRASDCTEL